LRQAPFEFVDFAPLRAVLHEGQTEGRVSLAEVCRKPHSYGVGAGFLSSQTHPRREINASLRRRAG
jgi:hypothetical protein